MTDDPDIDGPVRLLNVLRVDQSRLAEAEDLVRKLADRIATEGCCRQVEFLRDVADSSRIVLQLDFASLDDLESYLNADWRQEALQPLPGLLDGDLQRMVLTAVPVPV